MDRTEPPEGPQSTPAPGSVRPGGRTARTRAAVLEATLAELVETGYADARIDRIAARAGVAATTVYRRWGSLENIVVDLADDLAVSIELPDSHTLEDNLRTVARAVLTLNEDPAHRAWLQVMVSAAVRSPKAREALSSVLAHRRDLTSVAVRHAVTRGEVPPGTDPHEVIRATVAPLYLRMYVTGEPVTPADADRAAAAAALAARAGLFVTRPPE
ncbi:TetR-like C-terminal domain-containing protein [Kitasatospora paracochleata]|uniref:AcrR family transcriptional regulator n=1 Tax=Kitasatospora paracochleata TaxID=58354 RepID=A0ABT1J8V0_9ACTN|nr:TetR/AcrR family transcriptional regulator [Kitasatospora paracochleata]MCP2313872.1 AcrR family transcriptional regulator [Kitasatospora paracochleata]